MTLLQEKATERVKRGASWLDKVEPDWAVLIDKETLELQIPWRCVLGQVFEDRIYGMNGYGFGRTVLTDAEIVEYGFDVTDLYSVTDLDSVTYESLTAAWIDAIDERTAS